MKKIKVGLLPLYIALYDSAAPAMRPEIEAFYAKMADALEARGLEVLRNPVCCVEEQFKDAISAFEKNGAEAMITLHLAYSPSLEAARTLAETRLPLIVMDTTPDYLFDSSIDSDRINYNHGIHGVQDMCNLLLRNGKPFVICAGHWEHSDVLDRVTRAASAAAVWTKLTHSRVGLLGEAFDGMGDFQPGDDRLKNELGIEVERYPLTDNTSAIDNITVERLEAERAADAARFDFPDSIPLDTYYATERAGLAVRDWIESAGLTAFSMNFLASGAYKCFPTMPFGEACKAMARGIGYAGEGDALTAAFVGALLRAYPDATFAEMFCPNWQGGSVFFSHMGEFNLNAADDKPRVVVKSFPYTSAFDPTCVMAHFKSGKVCFADIAPTKDGFRLVLAEGEMLKLAETIGSFEGSVSGWFKPDAELPHFLEEYSRAGGTHHGALVYGAGADELKSLAAFGKMDCTIIR